MLALLAASSLLFVITALLILGAVMEYFEKGFDTGDYRILLVIVALFLISGLAIVEYFSDPCDCKKEIKITVKEPLKEINI